MAKATLEFDLCDPDDKMAHLRATKALDLALALWDLRELFFKEEPPSLTKEELLERFSQILEHNHLDMDELIN